jgi:spore coat polysaccharide biosynthesis protein SpsF
LFALHDVSLGETFSAENVCTIRPGHGLPPKYLDEFLGRRAARAILCGAPLTWDLLALTMKTVATIEARTTSSRLPGKVLLPVLGKPLLDLLIERLRRVPQIDQVVVATTVNTGDDAIEDVARRLGAGCFRGSEEDVLDRVLRAARSHGADVIVEITGDCPLIDPPTVSRVIDTFRANRVDYCANILERTYPRGMDVQVFPTAVLAEVARLTNDPADREHVSLYIYNHPERFRLLNVTSGLPAGAADLRLTVDTPQDFEQIRRIYEDLYPVKPDFVLSDILALFERQPELRELNRHVAQKLVR